jgi:hypothetical protein
MAADVVSYRSRKNRGGTDPAAKARRDKIVLAVLGVVLLALLAFEGPKMLKRSHGSSSASTAAADASATVSTSAGSAAAAPAQHPVDLKALTRFRSKDPFIAQLGAAAAPVSGPVTVSGPPVRATHFVAKDPFVAQLSLSNPAPAGSPGSTPPATQEPGQEGGNGHYIVILASIPLSYGHGAAAQAAAAARKQGVAKVKIVDSSSYPTLRTGFYAVYSGPYATLGELQPVLEQIRGQGFASAYTRRLAH